VTETRRAERTDRAQSTGSGFVCLTGTETKAACTAVHLGRSTSAVRAKRTDDTGNGRGCLIGQHTVAARTTRRAHGGASCTPTTGGTFDLRQSGLTITARKACSLRSRTGCTVGTRRTGQWTKGSRTIGTGGTDDARLSRESSPHGSLRVVCERGCQKCAQAIIQRENTNLR
jgi:hypothetical protein